MLEFQRAKTVLLKLLVAFALLFAAVQGFRLLLLPALQTLFTADAALTSLIRRCGILACALFAYWAYVRGFEKRPVGELRPAPLAITAGALFGAVSIALCMLVLFALGAYVATAYRGWQGGLAGVAALILIAALLEEIAYRGLLFGILERTWGTLPAMWLQSLVFSAMHLANAEDRASTVELLTTAVSGVLLGALWTMVYVYTRNLWVVTAHHAAWNFTIILAGVPLSGLEDWRPLAPLASEYRGSHWLTGGVFGPEDSLLTMSLVAACVIAMMRAGASAVTSENGVSVIFPRGRWVESPGKNPRGPASPGNAL